MSKMFNLVTKTWNPVVGCNHNCQYCWARRLAEEKLSKNFQIYQEGFKPRLVPKVFGRPIKWKRQFVFVCDMGDLFGDWVPHVWVERVLQEVWKAHPSNQFLFLTKNPKRYCEFKFPANVVLGATIETNRNRLAKLVSDAPSCEERYLAMRNLKGYRKLIAIEPIMDFDLEIFEGWIREIQPWMVYVGYDNYGYVKLEEPTLEKAWQLISRLEKTTETRLKTIRAPQPF